MSDVVIQIKGLGKQYALGGARKPYKTVRESVTEAMLAPFRKKTADNGEAAARSFWALKDIDFHVQRGEVVGVIGRNGAGKSTLLKILSRITDPTEGEIDINGRVGSLLEVGTGFHPELTGRENIYLNGAILGMKRGEIAKKFDEIIAFSETEKFLDTPVKFYSSGMYTRLAFAVAAHLEPEILIVDEVLAVGDAQFQKKCLGKMSEVAKTGRTILFVSHNMGAINSLCQRAILLHHGMVETDGPASVTTGQYWRLLSTSQSTALGDNVKRTGSGKVRISRMWFEDTGGNPTEYVSSGSDIHVGIEYRVLSPASQVCAMFTVYDGLGNAIFNCNSSWQNTTLSAESGSGKLRCGISELALRPGSYRLNAALVEFGRDVLDHIEGAITMEVVEADELPEGRIRENEVGMVRVVGNWTVEAEDVL